MNEVTIQKQLFPSPDELTNLSNQVDIYIKSGLLPSHIKTAAAAIVIALKGKELGIPPLKALSSLYVINGKVSMSSELMIDLVRERCPSAVINLDKSDDKECVITASRAGQKESVFRFSIEDATKAGLIAKGGVWNSYRAYMLRARCVSQMCRFLFPDILGGASMTPEEAGIKLDSKGNIIEEISKSEVINSPSLEMEVDLPKDLPQYVIQVGAQKGKMLKEVPIESLEKAFKFMSDNYSGLDEDVRTFHSVLKVYLEMNKPVETEEFRDSEDY